MAESKSDTGATNDGFPCKLTINLPFPSAHLARTALTALAVDAELSPLVQRSFAVTSSSESSTDNTVLQVSYSATTNRMLRVAVNGFFESVGVVVGVMKDLDVDVYDTEVTEGLEGVQGLVKG
ncbi:transcription factor Pcc1-domain-containing protein [Dendryphion nanum]|uniref:Transcription factor Pcc1-domain-containing protein n=1 Tax=Dendryphion nanum TaxID=256645 RepID=A0A9P9IU12_9PLEO|nr:transcription factor Pcc1-domain-containing protein [Dendryphion nanum]